MRSIGIAYALLAFLLATSLIFGQQPLLPGPPLGPMVNGTDFSGSWAPARFQDAGLGTAAQDTAAADAQAKAKLLPAGPQQASRAVRASRFQKPPTKGSFPIGLALVF